ncbi:MAG: cytochrome c [Gemmatimonadaceae bacterium]|jgi:mono/diheme cytochrome c family protein
MPSLIAIGVLSAALSFGSPPQGPDGKAIFDAHCKKCHGATGKPSTAMKKLLPELPVWDANFFAQRSDAQIVEVLMNGKGKNMKPVRDVLKPEEMLAVAKYIRTLAP